MLSKYLSKEHHDKFIQLNNYSSGIMLHHFHGGIHPKSQGSLSANDFCAVLDHVRLTKTILSAHEYLERANNHTLSAYHTCISFDDGLLSQYQIAKSILDSYGITAFFFIHSLPFFGEVDNLELYRYFRNTAYTSIDHFYNDFFKESERLFLTEIETALTGYDVTLDRLEFPFYTDNDKKFRFLRSEVLGPNRYDHVMGNLINRMGFDKSQIANNLYMKENHIWQLGKENHIIGLHSFSHPVALHLLSPEEQENEYTRNQAHIFSITGIKPTTVSHPCGKYTQQTLEILKRLGVTLGFAANMYPPIESILSTPREDSANLIRSIRN